VDENGSESEEVKQQKFHTESIFSGCVCKAKKEEKGFPSFSFFISLLFHIYFAHHYTRNTHNNINASVEHNIIGYC
jgi:hypothetical protein